MEGVNVFSPARSSRPRRLAKASVLATLGLSLCAGAAFGGLGNLAGSVRDHIYCKAARDCVYDEPTTNIKSGPEGRSDDRTPTFGFSSDEKNVTFKCRVDDKSFRTCSNPHTTAELDDGRHTLDVYAVDSDGLRDRTPATSEFVIDTEAPECDAIKGPKVTHDPTPVFHLSADEAGAKFSYRVDHRGGFKRSGAKLELRKLDRGKHVLEVLVQDKAGNKDRSPAKKAFRVSGKRNHR
jgi:hypothetical protein